MFERKFTNEFESEGRRKNKFEFDEFNTDFSTCWTLAVELMDESVLFDNRNTQLD